MTKLLLFPFYLTYKMIELPIKFIWWMLKMSIKLTLGFLAAVIIFALITFYI